MGKVRKKNNRRKYIFDVLTITAAIVFALGMTMAQVEASHLARVHQAPHQAKLQVSWENVVDTGCTAVSLRTSHRIARIRFFLRSLQ